MRRINLENILQKGDLFKVTDKNDNDYGKHFYIFDVKNS